MLCDVRGREMRPALLQMLLMSPSACCGNSIFVVRSVFPFGVEVVYVLPLKAVRFLLRTYFTFPYNSHLVHAMGPCGPSPADAIFRVLAPAATGHAADL